LLLRPERVSKINKSLEQFIEAVTFSTISSEARELNVTKLGYEYSQQERRAKVRAIKQANSINGVCVF
jgi:hypothetical protein